MEISVKFKGVCYQSGSIKKFKHKFETGVEFKSIRKPNLFKKLVLKDTNSENRKLIEKHIENDYVVDIFEQALSWVDDRNNTDIIHQYNLSHIQDYKIVSVGKENIKEKENLHLELYGDKRISKDSEYEIPNRNLESEKVLIVLDKSISDNEMKNDFLAVYQELHKNIKNLGYKKQFSIVLSSLTVAYKSAKNTLDNLNNYATSLDAIPKEVWKTAMNQNRMPVKNFLNSYLEGNLPEFFTEQLK